MTEIEQLIEQLAAHLLHVRVAARDNEFIDIAEVERLHRRLGEALDAWGELSIAQRDILTDAVAYVVRTSDEEDDLQSPIGFEDDAEAVDAALERITQTARGGKDWGAQTT